ncbi:iron ABC transporter permease [Rhodophyticola sp. CCM32]|uniref:lipocalin-like domain-containing protein n=1 Tax=Rhodophyticola sp. CCM32 TaxID=2916397 RepID=UPI00107F4437|nr:lipocalin-like domain-containing protein [Rhodophyticola sp. CCM32]QBY02019.1 iron ABC transporter permease [Rhodophyticola sp. CCM32]
MNGKAGLLVLCLMAGPALSQGFAGLGSNADGFAAPAPNPVFSFPADHGSHPEYRIEWWYLTATLSDAAGQEYGIQWTLFRSGLSPEEASGWTPAQLWMGHAGLTTETAHFHAERLARGGIGQAGVTAAPFEAWIDDWAMMSTASEGADALSTLDLTARGAEFSYDLALEATGPLIFQGAGGYSVKSADGRSSYYYSQPFYQVTGTLTLPDGPVEVTGNAWLDREWSSQPLSADQTGWDWFSIRFESGARLMGFALRSAIRPTYTSATWIAPDGTTTAYPDGALVLTPLRNRAVAGRDMPTEWRVELADRDVDIRTTALNPQSWMGTSFPYWEGPIRVTGSHEGRGYLEMTGYE